MKAFWQRRKAWILTGCAVLLGVAGVAAGTGTLGVQARPWVSVERRDLVLTVPLSGELEAEDSAQLGPPQIRGVWNFKLTFMAPEGGTVEAGQPVLGFDDSELRRELERVTANLDSAIQQVSKLESDTEQQIRQQGLELAEAEAKLRKAELKLDVPESLQSGNEVRGARIDHELAQTEVRHEKERLFQRRRSSEAQLAALRETRDRAKSRVALIQEQLSALTVKAPRAGTVIYLTNGRSEKKKPGDNCWWGERILEIPNLERMGASAEVEEVMAGRIQVGDAIRFRLDAFPDRELTAKIRSVGSTIQQRSSSDPVKVVRLKLDLGETNTARFRPGMRFQGEVEVERAAQALVVPLAAVRADASGPVVTVKRGFGKEQRRPTLGRRNGEWVEVLAGLEEGERIWQEGS